MTQIAGFRSAFSAALEGGETHGARRLARRRELLGAEYSVTSSPLRACSNHPGGSSRRTASQLPPLFYFLFVLLPPAKGDAWQGV